MGNNDDPENPPIPNNSNYNGPTPLTSPTSNFPSAGGYLSLSLLQMLEQEEIECGADAQIRTIRVSGTASGDFGTTPPTSAQMSAIDTAAEENAKQNATSRANPNHYVCTGECTDGGVCTNAVVDILEGPEIVLPPLIGAIISPMPHSFAITLSDGTVFYIYSYFSTKTARIKIKVMCPCWL